MQNTSKLNMVWLKEQLTKGNDHLEKGDYKTAQALFANLVADARFEELTEQVERPESGKDKRLCSGVSDKNGKLVYQGDVLFVKTFDSGDDRYFVVKYGEFQDENAIADDATLGWYISHDGMDFTLLQEYRGERQIETTLEVIGNIDDNPELLDLIQKQ